MDFHKRAKWTSTQQCASPNVELQIYMISVLRKIYNLACQIACTRQLTFRQTKQVLIILLKLFWSAFSNSVLCIHFVFHLFVFYRFFLCFFIHFFYLFFFTYPFGTAVLNSSKRESTVGLEVDMLLVHLITGPEFSSELYRSRNLQKKN